MNNATHESGSFCRTHTTVGINKSCDRKFRLLSSFNSSYYIL